MAQIKKRKRSDGSAGYQVRVRLRGYPTETATFDRLTDAREWAAKIETAMKEGRHFPERLARRTTLSELVGRYTSRGEFRKLSAREQQKRASMLAWWSEALGDPTLDRLTPELIDEAKERLAREGRTGRPISPATVNRYLAALSAAISKSKILRSNPVRQVDRGREVARVRFLSENERERLLRVCRESDEPSLYPLVVAALGSGARQGELMALRWRDVDLANRRAVLHETKNQERRAIYFPGMAFDALRDWSKVQPIDRRARVFGDRFPRKAWEAALAEAKIEDFRFHDLRHTAASYLAMSGATLPELAAFLGHKTLAMVQRYAHLTEDHTADVAERMAARFLAGAG